MAAQSHGGAWSTASGKRLMMPRSMIDEAMVVPSAKKVRVSDNALVQPRGNDTTAVPKGKQQNLAAFRCEACDGTHFWGHGDGHSDGKGGKFYRCSNSKCKKRVPYLPPHEQLIRKAKCGCVYCLVAKLMKDGKRSKEEARAEAEALLAAAAEFED